MSYSLVNAMYECFSADTTLISLLAHKPDGSPAIYPMHFRDVQDPAYPLITIGRFGSGMRDNMFTEDPLYAGRMDNPKIEICVWDKSAVDYCWGVYRRIDTILRGTTPYVSLPSFHMLNYKWRRLLVRDDLYDEAIAAYHLHSEYETWVYDNPVNPVPIPA